MPAVQDPWPWYVAGPLIGLIVPALLVFGGKVFGLSANLRHACAALPVPDEAKPGFLRYDWRSAGTWNLVFAARDRGRRLRRHPPALGPVGAARALGLDRRGARAVSASPTSTGFVPAQLVSWAALATPVGALMVLGGGFLVGFGARWAGGCTSGHAISGLADLQVPSLVAVVGFFAGGLVVTHVLLPLLLA